MAMSGTRAHPVYSGTALSSFERLKLGRKHGRYDFGRFDKLTGSSYYLGKGSIGDMEVACNFLFTKSRWGVLSEERNPGGIVYLDLVFTEPPDCRLKGAEVKLTLDEDDEDLRRHFASGKPPPKPLVPVHITEHGPQKLHGDERAAFRTVDNSFMPEISASGFGNVGGVGRKSQHQQVVRSNWRFSSSAMPDKRNRATTLKWQLSENELDRQPRHSNRFHTGFAFEHDGQPFFMQVEVSGELESTTSDLKHKVKRRFRRLKFPAEPQTATTLVNFGGRNNAYKDPLDQERNTLQQRMVAANMSTVPLVSENPRGVGVNGPFYHVGAETEEAAIEEETEDVSDEQPYITNRLTDAGMAQLREEAMAVLSLGQTSTRDILRQTEPASQPAQAEGSRPSDDAGADSGIPMQTQTNEPDTPSAAASVSDTSSATLQDGPATPLASSEQIVRLLGEANLPPLLQLIILWLMSIGTRRKQMEETRLLSDDAATPRNVTTCTAN
ncbi:hypothetical protein PG990_010491 [Apiospora arundinis]